MSCAWNDSLSSHLHTCDWHAATLSHHHYCNRTFWLGVPAGPDWFCGMKLICLSCGVYSSHKHYLEEQLKFLYWNCQSQLLQFACSNKKSLWYVGIYGDLHSTSACRLYQFQTQTSPALNILLFMLRCCVITLSPFLCSVWLQCSRGFYQPALHIPFHSFVVEQEMWRILFSDHTKLSSHMPSFFLPSFS